MKLIVKADCQKGGRQFDGLDCQATFIDYVDDNFPKGVSGGYMSFEYSEADDTLYVITEYETTRRLTPEEERIVIDYTQGQWSDGIGEGFEQQPFSGEENWEDQEHFNDDVVYNPSPWYHGQVAKIEYQD